MLCKLHLNHQVSLGISLLVSLLLIFGKDGWGLHDICFGTQFGMLLVLRPDLGQGQVERSLNDHGKLNVLLGLHSSPQVPSFFYVPKTGFWSTKFFKEVQFYFS